MKRIFSVNPYVYKPLKTFIEYEYDIPLITVITINMKLSCGLIITILNRIMRNTSLI